MRILFLAFAIFASLAPVSADEYLPEDNGIYEYHTPPRYRPSEEHPVRLAAYIVHPIGWLLRETITRPLSYLISSTEESKSIFGYREPLDYRNPTCFSKSVAAPDCRSILPYNYARDGYGTYTNVNGNAEQVYFPNVNFAFNSSRLSEAGLAKVSEVTDTLGANQNIVVVLEGHTDYIGSDQYNNDLGLKRAETVRNSLIENGINAERLSTVTFGETRPLNPAETDSARAENRRVEVHQE